MSSLLARAMAAALIAAPLPAAAQVDSFAGPLSPGNFWSTMQMDPLSQHLRQEQDKAIARSRGDSAEPATRIPPAPISSLRFTPSAERRKTNLAAFVAKTRAVDPAGAKQLSDLFASQDIIGRMATDLAPVGLRVDNLADAYAVWWVNCWSAVHGDFSTPDKTTAASVKAQATQALIANGQMATATDAAKQEFAEALLIQSLLLDASLQQAKGNPAQLKAVASAANQGAKGMGLDLTTMRLTQKGFIPAG